jgi:hypothetical protein
MRAGSSSLSSMFLALRGSRSQLIFRPSTSGPRSISSCRATTSSAIPARISRTASSTGISHRGRIWHGHRWCPFHPDRPERSGRASDGRAHLERERTR